MSQTDSYTAALADLMTRAQALDGLQPELLRAEREFFAARQEARDADPGAGLRFAEWFLLERTSDVLGRVPLQHFLPEGPQRDLLDGSLVGVFLVRGRSGAEVVLLDLQADNSVEVEAPQGVDLQPDDLLIGRLYAGSLDTYHCSPVIAAQRQAGGLAEAFRKDVRSLEIERRLSQAEIEHLMFRGRGDLPQDLDLSPPLERLEADLEQTLQAGGVCGDKLSATAISASLQAAARPGPVTNPLLEELAFDSKVDLQRTQELLLQIWNAHRARDDRSEPATGQSPAQQGQPPADEQDHQPGLGAEVARQLEDGLAAGGSIEEVFDEVDQLLGADPEEAPDARALAAAGEGDLRALILEFCWEVDPREQDQGLRGNLERLLRTQLEAPVPVLDLERLQPADLLRMLLEIYLQSPPGQRSQAVGQSFAHLQRFLDWAIASQQYELAGLRDEVRRSFVEPSVRLDLAGLSLGGGGSEPAERPQLFRLVTVTETRMQIATLDSDELFELALDVDAASHLEAEDLLLAGLETGPDEPRLTGMVVVLPALARDYLGT